MKMRWLGIGAVGVAAAVLALAAVSPVIPAVALSGAWSSVALPEAPLGIAEHAGKLWVCGMDEMIAESDDGGSHWVLRHEKKNGEMLFAFGFDDQAGAQAGAAPLQAFGTLGRRLVSVDGGVSWTQVKESPEVEWTGVALEGEQGYASNRYQFGVTSDGGAHWKVRTVASQSASARIDERSPLGVPVMLDGNDAAIPVLTKQAGGVNSTSDGGKHWHVTVFSPDWAGDSLRREGAAYKLYGSQAEKGKAPQPSEATSVDGAQWRRDLNAPAIFKGCTAQGCLVAGGWADMRAGGAARLLGLPEDAAQPLTLGWAASGDTFCRVSAELRCRTGQEAWAPQSDPMRSPDMKAPKAAFFPPPEYPKAERASYEEGSVVLAARIGSDGHIQQLLVEDTTDANFSAAAIKAVAQWLYAPAMLAGKAAAFSTDVEINFRLH